MKDKQEKLKEKKVDLLLEAVEQAAKDEVEFWIKAKEQAKEYMRDPEAFLKKYKIGNKS